MEVLAVIIIVFILWCIHKSKANERERERRLLDMENECRRLKKDYPAGYRRYAYMQNSYMDMELPYHMVIGKKSLIIAYQQKVDEDRKKAAEQDESLQRSQDRFSADCKAIALKHVPKCGLYSYSIPWNKHLPNGDINKSSLKVFHLFRGSTFSEQDLDYYQKECLQPDYSLDDLYVLSYLERNTFDHLPDYKNKREQLPKWIFDAINSFLNELAKQHKISILINDNIKDWDNEALSFHYQGINRNIPNTQIVSTNSLDMPIPDDTKYLVILDCYTEKDILIDNCKKIFNQPNPPCVIYCSLLKCLDRAEMKKLLERKKKEIDELVDKLVDEWVENDKKRQEERFLSNYKRIKELYPTGTEYYEKFKITEACSIPKTICRKEDDVAKYDSLYTRYLNLQKKYPRGIKEFEQKNMPDNGEALVKYNIEAIIEHEDEISQLEEKIQEQDILQQKEIYNQLHSKVKDWASIQGLMPYTYLLDYYPTQYEVDDEGWINRWTVWNFKNTPGKTKEDDHRETLDDVIPRIILKLTTTFGETSLKQITLVCIPASSSQKTEARYKEFSARICEATGMLNAYNHMSIIKDNSEKKFGGMGVITNNIAFNEVFFKARNIILFDDVITKGESMLRFKRKMEQLGANVICGFSIGRTRHPY